MLTRGTKSLNKKQIDQELERTAAGLGVSARMEGENAVLSGSCLSEHFERIFGLAADILLHPGFPDRELALLKTEQLNHLLTQRSDPDFLAWEMFSKVVYGDHPGSRLAPTEAGIRDLKREDLIEFHKSKYVPDYAVIGISGDITAEEAKQVATAELSFWEKAGTAKPLFSDPAPIGPAKIHVVHRPHSVQTVLMAGTQGIRRDDPDFIILTYLNQVLGSNSSRRLFQNLRERHAYTYGCYSSARFRAYKGLWVARTQGVRLEVTEPALKEILFELERIRTEPVPEQEMKDVKRMTSAEFALATESSDKVLGDVITRWTYRFPGDYWDRYPEKIQAVTPAEVQEYAKKFLAPDRIHIVAVGDAEKIMDSLKKFGPVEIFDTDGKPIILGSK